LLKLIWEENGSAGMPIAQDRPDAEGAFGHKENPGRGAGVFARTSKGKNSIV
jgi:hypothetical protein